MAGGSADRKCFEAEIGNIFNLTWCITDVTLKSNLITGGNTMPTQSPQSKRRFGQCTLPECPAFGRKR